MVVIVGDTEDILEAEATEMRVFITVLKVAIVVAVGVAVKAVVETVINGVEEIDTDLGKLLN